MSRTDYERLCSELDNTRHKDHPHTYDALSHEEREALQYWIERAIQPALKADERHSSYGLKHEYERETKLFVSHAQFKGAMLMAGFLPTEKGEQNWHFKIKPAYDEKSYSHGTASQNKRLRLPAYRCTPQGEQDPALHALVQKALASHRGDDTYTTMV